MIDAATAIAKVKGRHPWPAERPAVPAVPWVMDYGGRSLIKNLIAARRLRVIVEIGAFVMWEDRERVIPVRGRGCEMLPALHGLGLRPDLVVIDADKQADEIAICDELFPEAIVCGDDWLWCDGERFPLQPPVRESPRRQGRDSAGNRVAAA